MELIEKEYAIEVVIRSTSVLSATSYEEAVDIVKDSFKQEHNLELDDREIDPKEHDVRSMLDALEANGYEDASNFLQMLINGGDEE